MFLWLKFLGQCWVLSSYLFDFETGPAIGLAEEREGSGGQGRKRKRAELIWKVHGVMMV